MARRKLRPRKATKGATARSSLPNSVGVCKAEHASASSNCSISKGQRYRPGMAALRDIRRYEKSTDLILLRSPFERLVREMLQNYNPSLRFQSSAVSSFVVCVICDIIINYQLNYIFIFILLLYIEFRYLPYNTLQNLTWWACLKTPMTAQHMPSE